MMSNERAYPTVNLVNKDQLDILATLRESVNEDKAALEAELERLSSQNRELSDKNRMQLEQVNALLLEKVNLQSEGIGHREKMLQRERDFGYVGVCYSNTTTQNIFQRPTCVNIRQGSSGGHQIATSRPSRGECEPERISQNCSGEIDQGESCPSRIRILMAELLYLLFTQFIKSQDKLFKEQHTAIASSAPVSSWFMPAPNILLR